MTAPAANPPPARPRRAPASWVVALLRNDRRALARDPFLSVLLAGPVALVVIARVAAGPATSALEVAGVDAAAHHGLAAGFLVAMLVPHLVGLLVGLVLLDERDAGVLLAVRVSPVGLGRFLAHRLVLAAAMSSLVVGVGLPASGLTTAPATAITGAALLAAPLAAVTALLLPAFGSNKIEGLAVMKAAGLPLLSPTLAWFVEGPTRLAFGIVPTAWPALALWEAEAGGPWPWIALLGAGYLCALVWVLARRVRTRVSA